MNFHDQKILLNGFQGPDQECFMTLERWKINSHVHGNSF